jgi:cell division protein FtsB
MKFADCITDFWFKIPSWIKTKYVLSALIFAGWMIFFDQYNVIYQLELRSELNELRDSKDWYKEQIDKTRADLDELLTDNKKLEKFAREKYLMKKPDEEIFVIVKE